MERVLLLTQKVSTWFNSETILWFESETLCERVKASLLKHTRTQVETAAIASVWGGVGWENKCTYLQKLENGQSIN